MGSQRVRHNWVTFPFTSHFHCKGRREWMIGVTEVGLELTFASRLSPRPCCGNRLSLKFSPLCRIGFMSKWVSEGVWAGHAHTAAFNTVTNEDHRSAQGALLQVTRQPGWEGVWPKWTLTQLLSCQAHVPGVLHVFTPLIFTATLWGTASMVWLRK